MTCRKTRLVQQYLDNELTDKKIVKIEQHISACRECQDWLRLDRELNSLHKYVRQYKAPGYFTERVLSNLP